MPHSCCPNNNGLRGGTCNCSEKDAWQVGCLQKSIDMFRVKLCKIVATTGSVNVRKKSRIADIGHIICIFTIHLLIIITSKNYTNTNIYFSFIQWFRPSFISHYKLLNGTHRIYDFSLTLYGQNIVFSHLFKKI